jgi:phosphoribosylaminoimidazolecarboxamide formyltransferase/IMP cyclohydrolase
VVPRPDGEVDATACESWPVVAGMDALTSAYIWARDADPKSSFGDVVAMSHPITDDLAEFLTGTITDAKSAPGYEAGNVAKLARKRAGRFQVFDVDPTVALPPRERRHLFGMTLVPDRDTSLIDARLLRADGLLSGTVDDVLLALITVSLETARAPELDGQGLAGFDAFDRVHRVELLDGRLPRWGGATAAVAPLAQKHALVVGRQEAVDQTT